MTLTTRLSVFFLTTMAVVLVGFSVTLYLLARDNLYHETEEHLEGALTDLVAAAAVDADGVRWLRSQRDMNLAAVESWAPIVWLVQDDQGGTIDRSNQQDVTEIPITATQISATSTRDAVPVKWRGTNWLVRRVEVRPKAGADEKLASHRETASHKSLTITAAISEEPIEDSLFRLATALFAVSAAICLVALFAGRALCRRALAPLTKMASAAGEISADALDRRLPISGTGDELDNLGQSFNRLFDRLQESFERQKRFTSDASHQLRTPLAAILGQTEVALRRERASEEYQRVLQSIHKSADYVRAMVESLLFLARADQESDAPGAEEINLREWLTSHLQAWEQDPRSADIVLDASSGDCRVRFHPVLAGEMVNLLLDNACKYSQPGTPIHIGVERVGTSVQLRVQDQGIGIRDEDLARVFAPFFRAMQARQRGISGVGLGLSIAQRLAAAFGGTLSVTSKFGAGSCFALTLPAVDNEHAEVASMRERA